MIQKNRGEKFYFVFVFLIVSLLFITMLNTTKAAHAVCGKVNNAVNGMDTAWRSVIIYYEGDKENHISCEIGPEDNKYCCDSETIPKHRWKIGNTVFAEVIDLGDGYTAGPVSTSMTGAGYDVMPEMTLEEIISLYSPTHSIYTENSILFNVTTKETNKEILYNLDNENNISLCTNCNHGEIMLNNLNYDQHNLIVYAIDFSDSVKKKEVSFAILSSINFSRKIECEDCEEHKVPALTEVNMIININTSNYIDGFLLSDYYPNNWIIKDLAGGIINIHSETHNKIVWPASGKEISKSYTIKSPGEESSSIKYIFQSELDSQTSEEWSIIVESETPNTIDYGSSGGGYKNFIRYAKIIPGKPVFMKIDDAEISIKRILIKVKNEIYNILIKVKEPEKIPAPIRYEEVYQYIHVENNIKKEDIEEIIIEFTIDKSWFNKNNYSKDDVVLKRYGNGEWEKLKTSKTGEDKNYVYYKTNIKGLSLFAVSIEKTEIKEPEEGILEESKAKEETKKNETEKPEDSINREKITKSQKNKLAIILILAAIFTIFMSYRLIRKNKIKQNKK